MRSSSRFSDDGYRVRWARHEARALRGLTETQVHNVRRQAAKSATFCACCFRPLTPTDSVTVTEWKINKHDWLQMPTCLSCSLDDIKLLHIGDGVYFTPSWHRTRCLNCNRPMRVYGHPPFRPVTCSADCGRAHRYRRNNLRRRVKHEPMTCIQCGELFIPKRADAQTCSNKCRQALHREGLREARRKLPLGWRRRPLPDCPMCKGEGTILINLYGPCDGSKENSEPLRASCPCVLLDRPRGTDPRDFRQRLELTNQEMLATEKRAQRRAQLRQSAVTDGGARNG